MEIKVIACDMDGTLLNHQGTYNRQRFEAILETLNHRGIRFVVASGNNMGRLRMIFEGLADKLSYVAENGAYVLEGQEPLVRHVLDPYAIDLFLAYFEGKWRDYRVMLSTENASYTTSNAYKMDDFSMIDPEQMKLFLSRIQVVDDFSNLPAEPVLKLTMHVPVEECSGIIEDFNAHFNGNLTAVTSGYGAIDVIQTGIHKAWGLKHLLDKWGVSPDEMMAFGDGCNDIEMLRLAKYSYAMENAPEEVKDAARFVAPSHEEEGVLTVLESFLKGEGHV